MILYEEGIDMVELQTNGLNSPFPLDCDVNYVSARMLDDICRVFIDCERI